MSPFLAQVQVINVARDIGGVSIAAVPPAAPAPPDTSTVNDDALREIQANVAKIKANAASIASAAKAKAAADLERARISTAKLAAEVDADNDQDSDHSGDTTIHSGTSSVVMHRSKKSGGDDAGIIVPCVAIFFVFSWLIIRAVMAPFGQKIAARRAGAAPTTAQGLTDEEQAILVKLQRTIGQMERRIESLETILIDETRTKENYGTKH